MLSKSSGHPTLDPRFHPIDPFLPDSRDIRRRKERHRRRNLNRQRNAMRRRADKLCQTQLQQWQRRQHQAGNANFRFREERFQDDNIARPQVCQNPSSAVSHPGGRQNCNQNRRGREHCHPNHTSVHHG